MGLDNIKAYLASKITDSWYRNAAIDYGITGKFLDAKISGNDLLIIWEEEGNRFETVISWYGESPLDQIYNIWMEAA